MDKTLSLYYYRDKSIYNFFLRFFNIIEDISGQVEKKKKKKKKKDLMQPMSI